jgi:hypothetical protein
MEILLSIIAFILSLPFYVIVSELGYVFFSVLSGEKLKCFRLGKFRWDKGEDGKFHRSVMTKLQRKYRANEYVLEPPKNEADYNYKLALSGGLISSVLFTVILAGLCLLPAPGLLDTILFLYFCTGIGSIILHLVPMDSTYNRKQQLTDFKTYPELRHISYNYSRFSSFYLTGGYILDAPAEWFEIPIDFKQSKLDPNNHIIITMRYNRSWRFLLEGRFEEALSEVYYVDYNRMQRNLIPTLFYQKVILLAVCLNRFDEANAMLDFSQYPEELRKILTQTLESKKVQAYPEQMAERFARGDFNSALLITQALSEKIPEIPYENIRKEMQKLLEIMERALALSAVADNANAINN